MLRPHEKKRLVVGLALTMMFWAIGSLFYLFSAGVPKNPPMLELLLYWVLAFLVGYFGVFFFWIFPVFFVVAIMKLRDQKRFEFEELGDDNEVNADPEGQRKLHEYLTAINSTEARIGLLQRSEPWPGPESKLDGESPRRPILRFSKSTLSSVRLCVLLGFVAGVVLGIATLLNPHDAELPTTLKRTLLMRVAVSGVLGAVFAAPLGWIVALLFGKTEPVEQMEESHDAGAGGSEAA